MQITLDQIIGPAGALVVLLIVAYALSQVIKVLWADHLRADQADRDQRDRALALVEAIAPALKDLASAQHEANRDAAERHRRADAG